MPIRACKAGKPDYLLRYRAKAQKWAAIWGVPGLAGQMQIELSPRLRTSFARSYPKSKLIRLNPVLLRERPSSA
jgi:hypothetical protein